MTIWPFIEYRHVFEIAHTKSLKALKIDNYPIRIIQSCQHVYQAVMHNNRK